jgi:hypothetical protein
MGKRTPDIIMNSLRILIPSVLITGVILAALHPGVAAPPFAGVPVNPIPEPNGPNLFQNGDFANGTAGWELCNWGRDGRMEIDAHELHDGKPSLRVENLEPGHTFIRQLVAGKPKTQYRLTGYIKTKDVVPANKNKGDNTGAVLEIGRMGIYTPVLDRTNPWTKVTADLATDDEGKFMAGPSLGTDPAFVTGTAWFAGLSIIEMGAAPVAPVAPARRSYGLSFTSEGNASGVNVNADPTYLPIPETAKVFLDPVEMILKSAPGSALEKLRNEPAAEDAVVELNRYFGRNVVNRSIVLHTTVEEALAHPDPRNVFRIRAASTPLKWEGGTMQRLSYLYFKAADGPKAASVKVGSEIIVVGWVRKCLVERTEEGLRLDFDLQYSKIEDASAPLP